MPNRTRFNYFNKKLFYLARPLGNGWCIPQTFYEAVNTAIDGKAPSQDSLDSTSYRCADQRRGLPIGIHRDWR